MPVLWCNLTWLEKFAGLAVFPSGSVKLGRESPTGSVKKFTIKGLLIGLRCYDVGIKGWVLSDWVLKAIIWVLKASIRDFRPGFLSRLPRFDSYRPESGFCRGRDHKGSKHLTHRLGLFSQIVPFAWFRPCRRDAISDSAIVSPVSLFVHAS